MVQALDINENSYTILHLEQIEKHKIYVRLRTISSRYYLPSNISMPGSVANEVYAQCLLVDKVPYPISYNNNNNTEDL